MAQRRFFWTLFSLALLVWGGHTVYHHKALGFTTSKITSDFAHNPQWDVPCALSPELEKKLAAPFRYLAAGSQSYAFVSEDGTVVLKFFRMKHQIFHVKDLWRGDRSQERKENLFSIYTAHALAFREMQEDAGLLYLHLNKTDHVQRQVILLDKLGRKYAVDLDGVEFVIQERGELIFSKLKPLLSCPEKWNAAVGSVMQLIERRIARGISDHDKAVSHNFGFVGDRPIQLDIGRIHKEKKPQDYVHVWMRIQKWKNRQKPSSFSLQAVSSTLAPRAAWSIPPLSMDERARLDAIFSQKFTFLGEGAQAFALQSEDKKFVLKLFQMRRFTPSWSDHLCPHVVRRRERNLQWVFNGYKIGYDSFRADTGLVWIHLAKTNDLHKTVTLVDGAGNEHLLDLDTTECVLQEKAELLFDKLKRLYREGRVKEAQQAALSVLQLVERRTREGYADRDKAVSDNYGFVGDRPIHLDLGRLYKGTREGQLDHVKRRINRWATEETSLGEQQFCPSLQPPH